MTKRYFAPGRYWYDLDTMEIDGQPGKFHALTERKRDGKSIYVISDIPPYKSPLSMKVVDGRYARREEMKRYNVREVDPGEFKPVYHNKRFAERHGLRWTPQD